MKELREGIDGFYEDLDYLIQLPLNLGLIIDIEAREDKNILMNVLNKGF